MHALSFMIERELIPEFETDAVGVHLVDCGCREAFFEVGDVDGPE